MIPWISMTRSPAFLPRAMYCGVAHMPGVDPVPRHVAGLRIAAHQQRALLRLPLIRPGIVDSHEPARKHRLDDQDRVGILWPARVGIVQAVDALPSTGERRQGCESGHAYANCPIFPER